jgi:hypothetical protein
MAEFTQEREDKQYKIANNMAFSYHGMLWQDHILLLPCISISEAMKPQKIAGYLVIAMPDADYTTNKAADYLLDGSKYYMEMFARDLLLLETKDDFLAFQKLCNDNNVTFGVHLDEKDGGIVLFSSRSYDWWENREKIMSKLNQTIADKLASEQRKQAVSK